MEPITIAAIAVALGAGLAQVSSKLIEKGIIEPALEPATEKLKKFVLGPYQQAEKKAKEDQALIKAVETALKAIAAPTDDLDQFQLFARNMGLINLTAAKTPALRRQLAQAVITFIDPKAAGPVESLAVALRWPQHQREQLVQLLTTLRAELYKLEEWQAPIEYVNQLDALGRLQEISGYLARLDRVFVETEAGEALRVVALEQGLSRDKAAAIESDYRADLVRDLRMHDFRGIVQMRQDIRLPLADIYLELSLLSLGSEEERRQSQARLTAMREAERLAEEEERLRQRRVTDALARSQRLVILGEPGAGKTISLRFISLMLAYGYGAARLGLEQPYIPLMVRLADFARGLETQPALSLDKFLLQVIEQKHPIPHLGEFMRLALEKGACLILLDGLDEVGDDPVRGQPLHQQVVRGVQTFADRWCSDRPNRLVVASRIEGYWADALRGIDHVQLSPLQPPDEVEAFLQRWYAAHEQAHDPNLSPAEAQARSGRRTADLLPQILGATGVRRLITNPLLLTILALIYENVGKLPNRRIKLYEICAQTLIESWRQAQTGLASDLLADLGEETVIRIMAPLAYWLHETRPGGTASFDQWQGRLIEILTEEGFEAKAKEIADRFLYHARYQSGLLAERSLGQFGFFHLTFEEYLAARELARQRAEERREMLKRHWADPRWHEAILLAAGQLGIAEARRDDAGDFIEELLKMEPTDPADLGRPVVLAGRALADIGQRSVANQTRRWVMEALGRTMQDLDPDSGRPHDPPRTPARTRYEAGEVLDELEWLPPDLNAWLRCSGCARDGGDLLVMKYPVTNVQFERFVLAGGYHNSIYWGGEESDGWGYRTRYDWSEPRLWRDARFGQSRRGYPVVGVSWYEANAYAAWLTELLQQAHRGKIETLSTEDQNLIQELLEAGATAVRLPHEAEWEKMAGGAAGDRYPWDPPGGPATEEEQAILARANTKEAGLQGTSPVGMYPLGVSKPSGLVDLAGNVWEWTATPDAPVYVLRGGAWYWEAELARCGSRDRGYPYYGDAALGFRLVSPIGSGS